MKAASTIVPWSHAWGVARNCWLQPVVCDGTAITNGEKMLWLLLLVLLIIAIGGGIVISKLLFLLLIVVVAVMVFNRMGGRSSA